MAKNLAQLRRAALKAGVEMTRQNCDGDVVRELLAPNGQKFGDLDLHILVWTEFEGTGPHDYSSEIESIRWLEDCTGPECEVCRPAADAA